MDSKVFSYDEACAALDDVRELTTAAHQRLQDLRGQLQAAPAGSRAAKKLSEWISTAIHDWAEHITGLGALPKGLWTVDFDSGEGFYYCWTLNEPRITHFHLYEDGFTGRRPLSEVEGGPPQLLV